MNWLVESFRNPSTSNPKGYLKRIMSVTEYNGVFFITEKDTGVLISNASTEDEAWEKAVEHARSLKEKEDKQLTFGE